MQNKIDRATALKACRRMVSFYNELTELYTKHGMNITDNRGRRNILMSAPMEQFLAEEMMKTGLFDDVRSDGRTGEADICVTVNDTNFEIECKLTSPHQSSGSIAFQTDHDTLVNKGSLDYIYIIANEDFDGFCVIYFSGLTIDDFRGLSPGARGKVQMYKWLGMKKAEVLVGQAISSADVKIEKIARESQEKIESKVSQLKEWRTELESLSEDSRYRRSKLEEQISRGLEYVDNVVNNAADDVRITKQTKARYSFSYEAVGEIK